MSHFLNEIKKNCIHFGLGRPQMTSVGLRCPLLASNNLCWLQVALLASGLFWPPVASVGFKWPLLASVGLK